jgi:hypothetical protein
LELLESSDFSAWIRSDLWGWPMALTLHALGTALTVGFIFVIGLRLLGLFELIPYGSLHRLFPAIWLGLVLQLVSGFVLWTAKPTRYVADGAFVLKTLLVIVGVVLTVYFYGIVKREAASWDANGAVSSRVVRLAAAALIVWCTVVITGRLTGYLGAI